MWDILVFFILIIIFVFSRYFLRTDIEKKEHTKWNTPQLNAWKQEFFMIWAVVIVTSIYFASLIFKIEMLQNIVTFTFSIFALYIISLYCQRKILLIYGEEVEVSGQKYFKKWYKVSLFGLFVNVFVFFIGIFLCIQIFELNTFIQIGGLWAWILAFMWFTAPVWALDMIAWIILLQSKNFETGNVYYIYDRDLHVWIKSISLTEVKCIDLRYSNPIMFRPSEFRNLIVKNLSNGIGWKSNKILREKEIFVDYSISQEAVAKVCQDAYDEMLLDLTGSEVTNYFWDDKYLSLEIDDFANYAVKYKLFYSITSPFYIFKAERLYNQYLFKHQQSNSLYFSTPDLIHLEKTDTKKITTV